MVQLKEAAIALIAILQGAAASAMNGPTLFADVEAYVAHGDHLVGTPGAGRTADWLRARLAALDYSTSRQSFPVRQYVHRTVSVLDDGRPVAAALQWWPPEAGAPADISARIGNGAGEIALLPIEVKDQSYLTPALEKQVRTAAEAGAAAILLQTRTSLGADGPFLFNARAGGAPWPIPVLSVGEADGRRLTASGTPVRIALDGAYQALEAGNIVATLDRPGTDRAIVISTPYTGWGPCGGERGPGIALFLALADWARNAVAYDVILVATAGHEIGHSGMGTFLASKAAPQPGNTRLWLHLGASIATWARPGAREPNSRTRYVLFAGPLSGTVRPRFADSFVPVDTALAAFGEIADVKKAGYPAHFGFAGYGPHHHLPSDDASSTGPQILEDAGRRILDTLTAYLAPNRD